jgi:hypothetical protein
VWAAGKEARAPKGLKVIDVEYRTIGGLKYRFEDRLLKGRKELESVVRKSGDDEAVRLLRVSRNSRNASGICWLLGLSAMVTGLLTLPDHRDLFDEGTDRSSVLFLGGAALGAAGNLFMVRSETAKFNAVHRYNRVVLSARLGSF